MLAYRLAHLHQRLQDLVMHLDGLGIGLVVALGSDHVDEFTGQVDVGLLNGSSLKNTTRTGSGSAVQPLSCCRRGLEQIVSDIEQTIRIREGRQDNLSQILGLAGLMGAGRTEIMETLFGLRKAVSGSIELEGKKVEIKNPSDAVACGFALVPEDRRKEGLVLSHTIKENAILPISAQLVKNGIFNDDKAAHDIVEKNIQDLGVVADNMNQEIRLLSGGNQQKIVIAKWLNSNPKIFMFDEPTAGVDIVAKGEIISIIREFADKGGAVIFASSELAEMMAICDDIITIFDGKITGRIGRKELMKEEELQHAIQRK